MRKHSKREERKSRQHALHVRMGGIESHQRDVDAALAEARDFLSGYMSEIGRQLRLILLRQEALARAAGVSDAQLGDLIADISAEWDAKAIAEAEASAAARAEAMKQKAVDAANEILNHEPGNEPAQ